jgi:hypothetical protein
MLCLDKDETLRTNALNLNVFIEDYIVAKPLKYRTKNELPRDGSFELEPDTKPRLMRYKKNKKEKVAEYDRDRIVFSQDFSSVEFLSTSLVPKDKILMNDTDPGAVATIAIVLHHYYNFSKDTCNSVLKLRNIRNNVIAHHPGKLPIKLSDLRKIFEDVILNILKKDFPC